MRGWGVAAGLAALGVNLAGCAATTPTSKTAVDYNRIFAKSRDEVLVTNILRASAREPLQFSTMGNVTGGVRNTGSMTLPLTNLISRVQTIISPGFSINEGINPAINIVPLSNKEFTEGILRAVTPEEVNYFINQGWDQELILELVVGAVVCPNGNVVFNKGTTKADDHYEAFARMFANAERFPIRDSGEGNSIVVRMPAQQVFTVMKEGAGPGRRIAGIAPVVENGRATQSVDVTIVAGASPRLEGLNTTEICGATTEAHQAHLAAEGGTLMALGPINGKDQGRVILRSVEAIIYFLGETQRYRWQNGACGSAGKDGGWPYYLRNRVANGKSEVERLTILRIDRSCGRMTTPFRTFAQTHFEDDEYFLLRQADAGDTDRSLSTLTFLDELIALQTSQSNVTNGGPVLAIGAQ